MAIPERAGRYRVVRLLGTGGTSSVFVAHDPDLDVDVAVKVLADNLARREDLVARFVREARLLREIADPHVVAVHDIGMLDSGQPYFVMDLVEGGSLAERVAAREAAGQPVSAGEVLAAGRALADAVAAVHRRGLVHGDVKPENLYVRGDEEILGAAALLPDGARLVLGDFGLAGTGGDAGGGTEGYMAPEQRRGEETDGRADLYSCSAIVYRLLEGRPPSAAARARDARFAGFFAAGLADRPDGRPADPAAWLESLEQAVGSRVPMRALLARRPFLIGLIALVGLGAAAVAGVAVVLLREGASGRPHDPAGLAFDDGRLVVADASGRLFGARGGDGWEVVATVADPAGVAVDASGAVLVAQPGRHRVVAVDRAGRVEALIGTGERGDAGDGGQARDALLDRPAGVAVGADGEVYVVDAAAHRLRVARGGLIATLAGSGRPGDDADLRDPSGIAVAPDGTVYVADTGNNRVVAVDRGGGVSTLAGSGSPGFGGDGGPAAAARLSGPSAVAVGPDGTVYVADTGNHRLRAVATDGTITTLAGTGRAGAGSGPALRTPLDTPVAVAAAPDGSVYVGDATGLHVLRAARLSTLR